MLIRRKLVGEIMNPNDFVTWWGTRSHVGPTSTHSPFLKEELARCQLAQLRMALGWEVDPIIVWPSPDHTADRL